jgi:hypothetical protein
MASMFSMVLTGCSESTGRGAISFHLVWNGKDSRVSLSHPIPDQLVSGDVCSDYNIQWLYAQAIDQSGEEQAKAMWPCSQHEGRLSAVPSGTYRVIIEGEVAGDIYWRGELTDIEVTAGRSTDAGPVRMIHLHDHAAPVVVKTTPENGALQVSTNTSLLATFDDAIIEESITAENFILTYLDNSESLITVPCTVSYEPNKHIAILSPTDSLLEETQYTATIAVDQDSVVEDRAGNRMQNSIQWTFTTFQPDFEAPRVESRVPANGTLEVSLSPNIHVNFSEAMNPLTISTDSISLQHNGALIASSVYYDSQNNRAVLTPSAGLSAGSTYTVIVSKGVADLAGNPLAGIDSWSFVTQFAPWHTETIEGAQPYLDTVIALDEDDNVFISFQQDPEKDLKYVAQVAGAAWDFESIAGGVKFQDMVIDPNNGMHVLYYTDSSPGLYCYFYGGLVSGTMMGSAMGATIEYGDECKGLSLAVDSENLEHVSYYDTTNSRLIYSGGAPDSDQTIDTNGTFPDMAMATTIEGHVSYFDSVNSRLKYATNAGGVVWISETVDPGVNVKQHSAIAVDVDGYPHISYVSYVDEAEANLKYATKLPSGDWQIETVDDSGLVGLYTDIVLDSRGRVNISYSNSGVGGLMHANRTAMGIWHTQVVEASGGSGIGSSIIVDSSDFLHISHCDFSSGRVLKYATTRPPRQSLNR